MLDLIIRGGQVVTPEGVREMEVGVQGDLIAVVASPGALDVEARRSIDASGKIVLPGGIEPHTHIGVQVPDYWAGGRTEVFTQPPEAASRAAAFGGVTTFIDFAGALPLTPGQAPPADPIMGQVEARRNLFEGHSYTDFAFHFILAGAIPPQTIGEIGGRGLARGEGKRHGKADTRLPFRCAEQIYEWAQEPKKLVLYEGAEHRLEECREELEMLLKDWIPATLNAPLPG